MDDIRYKSVGTSNLSNQFDLIMTLVNLGSKQVTKHVLAGMCQALVAYWASTGGKLPEAKDIKIIESIAQAFNDYCKPGANRIDGIAWPASMHIIIKGFFKDTVLKTEWSRVGLEQGAFEAALIIQAWLSKGGCMGLETTLYDIGGRFLGHACACRKDSKTNIWQYYDPNHGVKDCSFSDDLAAQWIVNELLSHFEQQELCDVRINLFLCKG